ncbi:MAG: helix-hairpin-helix domain-containing protein [Defluviitaleaceae bacterium]|nr:helix-hairpin-helix domain-containing protein [Defluviitaleaceae bacterium]
MKRVLSILMAMLFLLYPVETVDASTYVRLAENTQAVVLQVIDGEALRVQLSGTNQVALVRLAGIDTQGNREAHDFISGALLGRTVDLQISLFNLHNDRFDDRWTAVYVTHGNTMYNRALVQRGLAWVDAAYQGHWIYGTLITDANRARNTRLGIWAQDGFGAQHTARHTARRRRTGGVWDERVNINTATATQINRVLYDVRSGTGNAIVRHRNNSPFQNVGEVKFADTLTREEFDYNYYRMKVSTNINAASEEELMQLIGVTSSQARAIVNRRNRNLFTSIYQLHSENLMSGNAFEQNRPFISVDDVNHVIAANRNIIVNVNTATASQLRDAGLTSSQADAVINARVNGYTLKSIGELQHMPGVNLTERRLHEIASNIRVYDVHDRDNWSTGNQWGQWDNWNSWGWTGPERNRDLININTASREDLWRAGFSDAEAHQLIIRRSRMNTARDIPFNVAEFDHAITLFTNVNNASSVEWMSLSPNMSNSFAGTLSSEALHQPFGSWAELRDFFYDNDYRNLYHDIRRWLVLR